jgi:hypothetical protein
MAENDRELPAAGFNVAAASEFRLVADDNAPGAGLLPAISRAHPSGRYWPMIAAAAASAFAAAVVILSGGSVSTCALRLLPRRSRYCSSFRYQRQRQCQQGVEVVVCLCPNQRPTQIKMRNDFS